MEYLNEIKNVIEKNIVNQRKYDYYKNNSLVNIYFEVGRLLVEAQGGRERSKYGDNLIKNWSIELTNIYGKGYDYTNLSRMRQFYIAFENIGTLSQELSWSHYYKLLQIKDENKRNYYINLCIKQNLSVRQLRDMIKNNAYERLSYKDKENINIIANEETFDITDMIKDPIYINIDKNVDRLSEKVLKQIILEQIEKYFIELGVGYAFIGSEYRLGNSYCDLLFYNYELNSFVVIELKIRKLIKQDIGQIEYYINYIDINKKKSYMNETVGIILCKENNKLVMKYCSNPNIYETTYELVLKSC